MASVGDLWMTDFGDPYPGERAAYRPALIIGPPDTFGAEFPFVMVVPLTTARRGLSLHVEVEPSVDTGLDTTSYVQCELIRSINRNRLVHRLGGGPPDVNHQVETVLKTLLNH
jgi:mRNA interferase MazF